MLPQTACFNKPIAHGTQDFIKIPRAFQTSQLSKYRSVVKCGGPWLRLTLKWLWHQDFHSSWTVRPARLKTSAKCLKIWLASSLKIIADQYLESLSEVRSSSTKMQARFCTSSTPADSCTKTWTTFSKSYMRADQTSHLENNRYQKLSPR